MRGNSVTKQIQLTGALMEWIAAAMPDAPDVARVRIVCGPAIPFDWLPGNRTKYIGITLWNRIWLREPFELQGEAAYELLFHELVHVRQFRRHPILFPLYYLLFLAVKGYRNHPAEIEARAVAADMRRQYFARFT